MYLTKKQIKQLESALKKADNLERKANIAAQEIAFLIESITGICGYVDHLQGDGFGFTPEINGHTHIPVSELILIAKHGTAITIEEILERASI